MNPELDNLVVFIMQGNKPCGHSSLGMIYDRCPACYFGWTTWKQAFHNALLHNLNLKEARAYINAQVLQHKLSNPGHLMEKIIEQAFCEASQELRKTRAINPPNPPGGPEFPWWEEFRNDQELFALFDKKETIKKRIKQMRSQSR